MLRPVRGLLAFSLALTVFACDSGDPDEPDGGAPPTPTTVAYGETVVTAATRAFSDAETAAVTEVSEDRSRVVVTTAAFGADPIAVGDVIVAGPSDAAPDGLLRRVTAVAEEGGSSVLTTATASLEDVIVEGELSASLTLDASDVTAATSLVTGVQASIATEARSGGSPFAVEFDNAKLDIDGDLSTDDFVLVTGTASVQPVLDIALAWSQGEATEASVTSSMAIDASLEAEWELLEPNGPVSFGIAEYELRPVEVTLGASPVRLVVTPTVRLDVVLDGPVGSRVTFAASYSLDATSELVARAGASPSRTASETWSGTAGMLDATLNSVFGFTTAALAVRPHADLELFGQEFATVNTSANAVATIDAYDAPWARLDLHGTVASRLTTLVSGPSVPTAPIGSSALSTLRLQESGGTIPYDVPPKLSDLQDESLPGSSCGPGFNLTRFTVTMHYEDPNGDAEEGGQDVIHRWRNEGTQEWSSETRFAVWEDGSTGSSGRLRLSVCTDFEGTDRVFDEYLYYDQANNLSAPLEGTRTL